MRILRIGVLALVTLVTVPMFAFCWTCDIVYGCLQCDTTFYNAAGFCEIRANGQECILDEVCEGELGARCTESNPDCTVHRADLRDFGKRTTEWQLVSVKIERPKQAPRS